MANNIDNKVAVILCSYDQKRHQQLKEAIDSIINQSHQVSEIIVVISSSNELKEHISNDYPNINIIFSEKPLGATQARNKGIAVANSDILAFTDDDIIADKDWIKNLYKIYTETGAMAVGGKILPLWLSGEPDYLPEELYWLVGAVHTSYLPDKVIETRNVYGPNMSFKKRVFQEIGNFNEDLGFADRGTSFIQGEEPEFGLRMLDHFGKGIVYNPEAIIHHKVPSSKLKLSVMLNRCFYQGYTKSLMNRYSSSEKALNPEKAYLDTLLRQYLPMRIKGLFKGPRRISQFKKLCLLLLSIIYVGTGFVYGKISNPAKQEKSSR